MATVQDAIQEMLRQNAEFMMAMQQRQMEGMAALMDKVNGGDRGGGERGGRKDLRDRNFREVGDFEGDEHKFKEWALKFRAVAKEVNSEVFAGLKWAEAQQDQITDEEIQLEYSEGGEKLSTMVYNRLIHHLRGTALTIHQGVSDENGFEVWRLLGKRYNPTTPMRGLQLMLKVMVLGKIIRGDDVQAQISKWAGWVHALERDYNEGISDRMKIGVLIHMMPEDLQDHVLQHADRLQEYKLVKEKVVGLIDARARLKDPDAMNVGYAGYHQEEEYEEYEPEVCGMTEDMQCYRCGGYGHRANICATPATPKGKGKGKGQEKGGVLKGKGKGYKGAGKGGKGQGMPCMHCGKTGHTPAKSWTLHPDQLPWRRTSAVEEEEEDLPVGGLGFDVGMVEVCQRPPGLSKIARTKARIEPPSEQEWKVVKTKNRFEALGEREWSVGAVEIEMPLEQINAVESKRMENLRPAGRGKITIDSGAAESVLPADMLPNEKLMDGGAKKRGVRYVAAHGGKMDNLGEKKVRFRRQGSAAVSSIMFQVTDVGKPLASVSRILDKGNIVVFSRKGSYIMN